MVGVGRLLEYMYKLKNGALYGWKGMFSPGQCNPKPLCEACSVECGLEAKLHNHPWRSRGRQTVHKINNIGHAIKISKGIRARV